MIDPLLMPVRGVLLECEYRWREEKAGGSWDRGPRESLSVSPTWLPERCFRAVVIDSVRHN